MRVLFDALQAGNRSGTGQYVEQLLRHLPVQAREQGIELFILWPEHAPVPPGIEPESLLKRPNQGALKRIWFEQIGMRRLSHQYGVDLIHYPANVGSVIGARNTVLTVHDLSYFHNPDWFRLERAQYYRKTVWHSVRTVRRFIADSQATAYDLKDYLAVPLERIDVVYLGVEPRFQPTEQDPANEVKRKYDLPDTFFLYLGTLEPRKNLVRLVQAYDAIATNCPWDLVLAGREGWKTDELHRAVKAATHRDRIHLPGFVPDEDLPALYSACEAFVYPSLCEGFGLPMVEAMACGAPVLTSNRSSLPEVTGEAALQVDPFDVDALADGLERLQDDACREQLRTAGFEHVRQFKWEHTAAGTLETYRKACEGD